MPLSFPSMDFLINRTQKPSWNPHLLGLPNDTIVDRIFVYLDVADILCVRRTCKLLYHLTHHAVLWKRLLRSTELPIPPVPPTSRHSLKNLSAFEAERLMVRAASLAWCWQWTTPQVFDAWKFEAYHRVKQMVLLPGSQYMVASVCETNGTNWSLVVYVMDGRYNVVPIAKMPTDTKAYNVVAKYLTIDGVDGITIAYIRRAWRHRADAKKGIDISEYSGDYEVDPPYPIKYECHALHVPLNELEALCDPRFVPGSPEFLAHAAAQPPPFRRQCFIRSSRPLGAISLDEIRGRPFLTVLRYPMTLMFKPLDQGPVSIVTLNRHLEYPDCVHKIQAYRPLPNQNQVLIVREVIVPRSENKRPVTSIEFCPIPKNITDKTLEVNFQVTDYNLLYHDRAQHVWITDVGTRNWFEDELDSELKMEPTPYRPRPINVIFKVVAPDEGLLRITLYPRTIPPPEGSAPVASSSSTPLQRIPPVEHHYKYDFDFVSPVRFVEAPQNTQYRILTGVHRILTYTVPWDDITESPPIINWYRYVDRELFADVPEPYVPTDRRRPLHLFDIKRQFPKGCTAFSWDEMIGRVVYTVEGTSEVHVLEFSKRPKEDLYGRRMPLAVEQEHYLDPGAISAELADEQHPLGRL